MSWTSQDEQEQVGDGGQNPTKARFFKLLGTTYIHLSIHKESPELAAHADKHLDTIPFERYSPTSAEDA